jgi:hypothetical protein
LIWYLAPYAKNSNRNNKQSNTDTRKLACRQKQAQAYPETVNNVLYHSDGLGSNKYFINCDQLFDVMILIALKSSITFII